MKLRRRILKYCILLIICTSAVNLAISYYLTQASADRFSELVRSAFLEQAANNLMLHYEAGSFLTPINEANILPRELSISLPSRFSRSGDRQLNIAIGSDSGWDIVVADEAGRIILGGDKTVLREEPAKHLRVQGRVIGKLWLVPKQNSTWELMRNYLFLPMLFRNFLTVLVSSAVALGIAFLFSDYLARHIGELALAARNIANGRLEYRVQAGARDELGELAADFNTMAEKLQEDQRLRRQLQADVVHELRTPLAVCQAIFDSLDSGVIRWDDKALASLQEETNRMNRLVTDLHELNRADNQQLPLYKELFSVGDLIERIEESFAELARKEGVAFSVETVTGSPEAILYADPDRIMQVFNNILHNALRHTPAGGAITLRVWPQDDKMMTFAIADTGEGIPEEFLPHVFDRFFSGDKSRSRQRSGTGLGLAIAKEYTLLHGGAIMVRSVPNLGSEFTVTLPVEQEPAAR